MPGYIKRALAPFNVILPMRPQQSLHVCAPIHYGAITQLTNPIDSVTPPLPLDTAGIRAVQELVGILLYYRCAIDSTILVALDTISSQQSSTTEKNDDTVKQLLHYIGAHPDTTVRYNVSEMMLHIHSDAS